jgi:hypothetical protein
MRHHAQLDVGGWESPAMTESSNDGSRKRNGTNVAKVLRMNFVYKEKPR